VVTWFGQLEPGWFWLPRTEPKSGLIFGAETRTRFELEPKLDSRIKTGSDFLIVDFIGKMLYERCEDELEQFVHEGKNKHITQRVSAYQIDQVSYKSAQTVNNQSVSVAGDYSR
jgi:hypothetical protein